MSKQSSAEHSTTPLPATEDVVGRRRSIPSPTKLQAAEQTGEESVSPPSAMPEESPRQAEADVRAAPVDRGTYFDPGANQRSPVIEESSVPTASNRSSLHLSLAHPERLHAFAEAAEALQGPRTNIGEDDDGEKEEGLEPPTRAPRRASKRYGWLGGLELTWEDIRRMFED